MLITLTHFKYNAVTMLRMEVLVMGKEYWIQWYRMIFNNEN